MSKKIIVTDSACDIQQGLENELPIRMVPFVVNMDGKEYISRKEISNEEFYALLESSPSMPTHSQITAYEFEGVYEELYQQGYEDAVVILINSEGSSTYDNSGMAAEAFYENHPEARDVFRIHRFDSESYNGAYGYAVIEAAKMVQQEKPVEEILAFVRDWLDHAAIYFGMYSLKYAKRSGRIPSAAAFVGEALGLKPVMFIDDKKITTAAKTRGEKNLIPTLIKMSKEKMAPGTGYSVINGSNATHNADIIKQATEAFGSEPEHIFYVGAAVAANAGHDVVGIVFRQK